MAIKLLSKQFIASNSNYNTGLCLSNLDFSKSSQLNASTSSNLTKRVNSFKGMRIFVFLLMLFCLKGINGQVNVYSFTQTSGTYTAISGGTSIINAGSDDVSSSLTSIGFNFAYDGNTFTTFAANSNGFIRLGALPAVSYTYYPLDDATSTNVIAFAGNDGRTGGAVTYLLQGTAPNRYLTIQFPSWNLDYSSSTDYVDVQIILYETTNKIQIVYGSSAQTSTGYFPQVGINGVPYNTNFKVRTLATTWAASVAATSNWETMYFDDTYYPASGLTYTFELPACVAPTNQPTALNLTPTPISISGTFTAATGAPTGYLVVRTNSSTPPTAPTNGTTYTPGSSALGGTIVASGASTSFVSSGLTPSTTYYYWVYSYNGGCNGAPSYRTTAPLSQSSTTSACSIGGTKTVGPTGNYATLTAAFVDMNNNGLSSSVILELQSTYTSSGETFPINILNSPCLSSTNTITIRPASGATALSITSSSATGTINLNGTNWVTFDGRAGGTGSSQLTISNTSTTGYAVQFINSARFNTIKYCTVAGVNSSLTGGVILFSNAVGLTTGNSNNTIDNCDIRDGATTPTNLIYNQGNTTDYNSSNNFNTISNSTLHDWFNPSTTGVVVIAAAGGCVSGGAAITLWSGSSDWTITGNSFYQSASRTFTMVVTTNNTGVDQGAIFINSPTYGHNFSITNNYFGGSAANCGGTAWTYLDGGTATPTFRMISIITAIGAPTVISGNTIANISVSTLSGSSRNGLIVHQAGNVNVLNNTLGSQTTTGNITFNVASTLAVFFLPIGTGTNTLAPCTINIKNNNLGGIKVTTTSTGNASFRLLYSAPTQVGSTVNIIGNTAGGTVANSILQQTNSQLFGSLILNPSIGDSVCNNTFRNLTIDNVGVTGSLTGVNIQAGGGRHTITGNTIYNLTTNSTNVSSNNAASIVGITMTNNLFGPNTISGNTIYGLTNINTTVAGWVIGITSQSPTYPQSPITISNNLVHSLNSTSPIANASIAGIFLPFGGNALVYNNMVRLGIDTSGASITNSLNIYGLYKAHGNNVGIYNNSVYIGGTGVIGGISYAFIRAASGTLDTVSNNIFVNERSNGIGTGTHYAISLSSATNILCNYNDYLATGTGGMLGVFGTNYSTMAAWRTATNLDDASVSSDPKFLNTTGSTATLNLHINTSSATPVERSGMLIPFVSTDFDGQSRASLSPNDIGADAGNFTLSDLTAPAILFTPLLYTCSTGDRTLSGVSIKDATGVPTSGTNRPRIYYRKGTGSWFSQPGTLTSGSATDGVWSFTIVASDMSGLVTTDIVSYYVIAQDNAGPYIASNAQGVVATDVNTITTAPLTPNTYNVITSLVSSGTYNVGAGQTFTTLTAAVAAYNTGCISGPIVFALTDASYSTLETFPITILANPYASSTNTLTIKPTLANTTISGSSTTGLIVINGGDWININGSIGSTSNTVCPAVAASRDLTITNASTSTLSAVVWLQTNPLNLFDGATNNKIMNVNITGNGNTQTLVGIGCGTSSIGITSLGTQNNNNAYINNSISKTQYGIYSQGLNIGSKNSGTVINQNLINTVAPNNTSRGGIIVGFEDNISISGNSISEIALTSSPDVFGITTGSTAISTSTFNGNEITNATITKNNIGNIRNTGTFSACGIFISAAISGTNTISNNMITGVSANGTAGDFSVGLLVGGGAGSVTKIYNNTITMTNTFTNPGASDKSYALAIGGLNAVVDVRNNIFYNTQNNGSGNNYAVGYGYTPHTNLTSNNNEYYVGSGANFMIGGTFALNTSIVNQPTIANLQAATLKDGAALNITPGFVSTSDMHLLTTDINNLCLNGAGVALSGITDDIDCQVRGTLPDIGADEFTPNVLTVTNPTNLCPGGTFNLTAAAVTAGSQTGLTLTYWTDANATSSLSNPSAVTVAGTYYIKASNSLGCSVISPVTVAYYIAPAAPTVTSPIAYCQGATASPLTATPGSGNTLNWYTVPTGGTASSTAPTPSTASLGSTSYYVSQTTSVGCEGPRATIVVNINPVPGAPSVTSPVIYCQDATASPLSATPVSGNTLNWYTVATGGTGSSTAITPSTSTVGTTTYYVSQSNSFGCESGRTPITVTVTPKTSISVQPSPVTQCANTTANFSVTANGTGTIGYQWYKDGVLIPSATSSTYSRVNITVVDSGIYTVVVSSACGSNVTSNGAKLTIASVVPTITPASLQLCQGNSVTLQASPTGGNVLSYQWKLNGNDIVGATSSTLVVNSVGNYSVQANYVGGCNNTSLPSTITVAAAPTANFTINNIVQCVNGNSYTFTNTSTISSGTLTYAWSFGDATTSTATNPSKSYSTFGSYNVKLVVTSNNGCKDSITKVVSVNPKPTPSFTVNNSSQCLNNNSFSFTNTSSIASGSVSYLWNFGDGTTSTATNPSKTYSTSNTFTVKLVVTSTFGCADSTSQTVTVNPNPTPSTPTGATTVCSSINAVTVTPVTYTTTLVSGLTYSWSISGGTVSGSASGLNQNTVNVIWGAAGTGAVTVTATNTTTNCSGSSTLNGITINPSPTAIVAGPSQVCLNDVKYYSLSNTTGGTITGYFWTVSGGNIVSGQGTSGINISWPSTGAKTIFCTLTNSNGCTGLTPIFNVNTNANPGATFTGITTVCTGTPYTYTATTSGNNYVWTATGGAITAQSGSTVTIVWSNVTNASLMLKETLSTSCFATTSQAITVNGPLNVVSSGPTQVCNNSTQTYTISGVVPNSITVTGGTVVSATSNTATILWNTVGTQTITAGYLNGACQYFVTYSVNVNALPTPVVTGANAVCTGTTIGYSTASNPGRNFAWTVSTGGTIMSGQGTNAITVLWNTAGANTVGVNETIIATGCNVTSSALNVTVTTSPTSTITGSNNVCSGGTFSYAAPAATTYAWTVSGGTISGSATGSSISVVWGAGPAGSVTVITSNGICNSTSTMAVIVNTTPTPTIIGANAICSGTPNIFSAPFNSNYTYVWTVTNGTYTLGGNSNSINVTSNTGATSVTVAVTASLNGTTCTGSASKVVTVNATPTVTITGNATACQNSSQTYTGNGASTYVFSVSGGVITSTTATTATITWGSSNGTVSVIGTSVAGCSSSGSLAVTVNSLPSSVITGSAQVCANNSSNYSVASQAGATYAWTATGGTISGGSTGNGVTVNWGAAGAGTVNVTVTSSLGCISNRTMNVTINVQPTPTITGAATACVNTNQTYSIAAIAGSAYNWIVTGGNLVSGAGTNTISVDWTSAGAGSVSVSQSTGICMASTTKTVTVDAAPAIPVVFKVGNVLTTSAVANSYQWFNNGTAISGATTNTHTALTAGTYTVRVTNAAGCNTFSSGVIANVGIKNTTAISNVTVYPNPAREMITISASLSKTQWVTLNLFDMNGKLVYTQKENSTDANFTKTVSLEGLSSGVYMIQIITNNGSVQNRIVKQ